MFDAKNISKQKFPYGVFNAKTKNLHCEISGVFKSGRFKLQRSYFLRSYKGFKVKNTTTTIRKSLCIERI